MIFACRQLFPRKGIRFLIEAVAQLKPQLPGSQAGAGRRRLRAARAGHARRGPRDRGRRDFPRLGPQRRRCRPYYRAAAVSVIPSLEEGFGIPAAEAMGCEVPVVASDAGGLPEVVEDGVTGLVVPRGDSSALATGDRVACWTIRTAGGGWDRRGGSARSGFRLGPHRGAVRAALPRHRRRGEPVSERLFVVPLGRRPPRLRHRRHAADPRGVPRLRRAQHLLRQHGPVHQPPRVAGEGRHPLQGQAGRS